MKKLISFLALLSLVGAAFAHNGNFPATSITNPSMSFIQVTSSVGFESKYVYRGVQLADYSIQPNVSLTYPLLGFDFYVGAFMNSPLEGQKTYPGGVVRNLQEVDLYAGLIHAMGPFKIDVGYMYYWYPVEGFSAQGSNEIHVGLVFDTGSFTGGIDVRPSLYYYYNFDLDQHTIESNVSYDVPLGSWLGFSRISMPTSAFFGYLSAGEAGPYMTTFGQEMHYFYYGASIDIALHLTDYCNITAGVRYAQNFDSSQFFELGNEYKFWYGVKVNFGF